jgi:hypothetical protein
MALFVTRHQHDAEACPAGHPQMGPMLLQHVSKANAAKSGVNILGEAVVKDHTFFMIVEAADMKRVQEFMAPFAQAGKVEVWEGATCEAVVARKHCGAQGRVWTAGRVG